MVSTIPHHLNHPGFLSQNDQEMLDYAGSPVLMGNAVSALKTRDWPITATNDECGLALAINNLLAQST